MTTILLLSSLAGAASLDVYPGDDIVTLTESLTAGSEVVFHAGTYTLESSLYWTGEGTAQAPIVLRAADGEAPVIEIADGSYLARVEAASWVTIQGLSFQGAAGWEESSLGGLQILGSNNVTLSDCEISQVVSTGIYVAYDSSNISITGNHIHDVASSTAVYVGHSDASYFVLDSEISYNWIHDIGDEYDYAIYLAAGTQGATVQHNVIYNINTYGVRLDST
jgi:parallel beta-helix repeat protein